MKAATCRVELVLTITDGGGETVTRTGEVVPADHAFVKGAFNRAACYVLDVLDGHPKKATP